MRGKVTWGLASCGADSRRVQKQLTGVRSLKACGTAFAAIREDGEAWKQSLSMKEFGAINL